MKPAKNALGKLGEDLAADFLKQQGYTILERNFRSRIGEIDIVASPAGENETICFIEVKTRTSEAMGSAAEAVSIFKQKKIILMALNYLKLKNWDEFNVRFDVVAVQMNKDSRHTIDFLTDAFEA